MWKYKGQCRRCNKAVFGEDYQQGLFPGILLREVNTRVFTQVRSISLQITKLILTHIPTSCRMEPVEELIQLWSAAKAEVICMDVAET